jgi:hypothetical protein
MNMKLVSILLLLGICLSIVVPSAIQVRQEGDTPVIVTLDVCHTANGGVPASSEMPFLHEYVFTDSVSTLAESLDITSYIPNQLLLSSNKSRPPRA